MALTACVMENAPVPANVDASPQYFAVDSVRVCKTDDMHEQAGVKRATPHLQGVTLKTYQNMALAGPAITTTVLATTACSLPGGKPLSAELAGTIAFPADGGVYHFDCRWENTTIGFVWVDGHLVCQDGNAYRPPVGTTDNPLPINTLSQSRVVQSLPFRAHLYSAGNATAAAHDVGVSVTWAIISTADYEELLDKAMGEADAGGAGAIEAAAAVHRMLTALPHVVIPASPHLSKEEQQRDELQRGLATGWGSWLHENMLPVVKLPEAAVLTPAICSKSTGKCVDSCVPDGARPRPTSAPGVETRVGHHSFDRSYVQFYFGGGITPGGAPNISVEYSASADGRLDLLLTPQSTDCGGNCSDWEVQLSARYAWLKAGGLSASGSAIEFTPAGLPPLTVRATAASAVAGPVSGAPVALTVALSAGRRPVGFSTSAGATVATISARLAAAKEKEETLLAATFGAGRAGEGQAIKAAVMWNLHSTPAENAGAPFLPVSRVWGTRGLCPATGPDKADFTYILFEWDNLFASLLAATGAPAADGGTDVPGDYADGFGIAISNLFQGGIPVISSFLSNIEAPLIRVRGSFQLSRQKLRPDSFPISVLEV